MKKRFVYLLIAVLILSISLVGCAQKDESKKESPKNEPVYINIATGGTTGTYFPLGGGIAEIWNKNIEGINATAETTGASVANTNMLRNGEVDVIFVQNDIAYYASSGTEAFEGNKFEGIRGFCTLYPETIQIVTFADKGIEVLDDLKDKKVAVGAIGSGTEANARQILNAAGITYEDIEEKYLSFSEAAQNLKDGNIDVAFLTAGFPTAAVQDISAQHNLKFIPVPAELTEKLAIDYPFYTKITIPAGTYNTVDVDVEAVAVKAMLAVSDKLDEELAYKMLEAIYGNPERLKVAHKKGELIVKENGLEGMSIDLHPGAAKFFND